MNNLTISVPFKTIISEASKFHLPKRVKKDLRGIKILQKTMNQENKVIEERGNLLEKEQSPSLSKLKELQRDSKGESGEQTTPKDTKEISTITPEKVGR
jgi:hypothetical protein